jgi:hypothetical protein
VKRKPLKFTARERKFCTYACESLGVIMIGLTVFAFQAQNLLVAQVWFLAGVSSIFLGVYVERRFGVQGKETIGVLTPILLVGILVAAFAAIYLSRPSLISPVKQGSRPRLLRRPLGLRRDRAWRTRIRFHRPWRAAACGVVQPGAWRDALLPSLSLTSLF